MDRLAHLTRLFAYDGWANRETLAALRAAFPPPARSLRWLGHIVGCQWLWLGRLQGAAGPAAVWPDLSLDQCGEQLGDLARAWAGYLGALPPERLGEPVSYVNSLGEPWTSTVDDILEHTVMHGAYHRGQIAADLRQAGHAPAYTDFIHAVRRGFVRP